MANGLHVSNWCFNVGIQYTGTRCIVTGVSLCLAEKKDTAQAMALSKKKKSILTKGETQHKNLL
jgi:hypothetical protein